MNKEKNETNEQKKSEIHTLNKKSETIKTKKKLASYQPHSTKAASFFIL